MEALPTYRDGLVEGSVHPVVAIRNILHPSQAAGNLIPATIGYAWPRRPRGRYLQPREGKLAAGILDAVVNVGIALSRRQTWTVALAFHPPPHPELVPNEVYRQMDGKTGASIAEHCTPLCMNARSPSSV
jgi:hypothetical protein